MQISREIWHIINRFNKMNPPITKKVGKRLQKDFNTFILNMSVYLKEMINSMRKIE